MKIAVENILNNYEANPNNSTLDTQFTDSPGEYIGFSFLRFS